MKVCAPWKEPNSVCSMDLIHHSGLLIDLVMREQDDADNTEAMVVPWVSNDATQKSEAEFRVSRMLDECNMNIGTAQYLIQEYQDVILALDCGTIYYDQKICVLKQFTREISIEAEQNEPMAMVFFAGVEKLIDKYQNMIHENDRTALQYGLEFQWLRQNLEKRSGIELEQKIADYKQSLSLFQHRTASQGQSIADYKRKQAQLEKTLDVHKRAAINSYEEVLRLKAQLAEQQQIAYRLKKDLDMANIVSNKRVGRLARPYARDEDSGDSS